MQIAASPKLAVTMQNKQMLIDKWGVSEVALGQQMLVPQKNRFVCLFLAIG